MNKLLAVVGQAGSGKDTAANYISKKYGYIHISTADILRNYINTNNLGNLTRENMSKVVEELRAKKGNDVLVQMALENYKDHKVVLSALRHPDESQLVIQNHGIIIDVYADFNSRYLRNLERNREGDNIDKTKFEKLEKRENSGVGFDINEVENSASYKVQNNGSYKDFYSQIDGIMKAIS